jgi:hypothetical protein
VFVDWLFPRFISRISFKMTRFTTQEFHNFQGRHTISRMSYTIGIVWYYYTKTWYSIGIVEFLKMIYTLYWNYTKYIDCGNIKTSSFKQTDMKSNSKFQNKIPNSFVDTAKATARVWPQYGLCSLFVITSAHTWHTHTCRHFIYI